MPYRISVPFGKVSKIHPHGHKGIDVAMPENSELRSVMSGVVEKVVNYGDKNIGRGILIRFEDGTTGIYGHMNQIYVSTGDTVEKGSLLGLSGSTGRSFGAHLHFGLKDTATNTFIDPSIHLESLKYMDQLKEPLIANIPDPTSMTNMFQELWKAIAEFYQILPNFIQPLLEIILRWVS